MTSYLIPEEIRDMSYVHVPDLSIARAIQTQLLVGAETNRLRADLVRLAEELESEGSTDQLDSAYRLREVLVGTYEFDSPHNAQGALT